MKRYIVFYLYKDENRKDVNGRYDTKSEDEARAFMEELTKTKKVKFLHYFSSETII